MDLIIRLIKSVVGVLMIPLAFSVARCFYIEFSHLKEIGASFMVMERGVLAYALMHTLLFRPVYLYVVGHELVHVIATWICGGKIASFNIAKSGGSVVTSKTNIFIELSPYFVPIYTILLGPIFIFLGSVFHSKADLNMTFLFFVGFTLAFHFVMTTEVLKMEQSDVAKSGVIFSLMLIFILNMVLMIGYFSLIFNELSFVNFAKATYRSTLHSYQALFTQLSGFSDFVTSKIR
ncbi:MAG: hypothetical protein HQL30_06365 [Candidatus Omnitrophica bacterium]|nr:hypothetical protein [Candidatus Omnitrophota bacterium]